MERMNIKSARVAGGIVEILQDGEYFPSTDTIINSIGEGDSDGFVLIGESGSVYITNTQLDFTYQLERLIALCEQVEAIGNKPDFVIGATSAIFGQYPDLVQVAGEVATIRSELESLEVK